MAIVIPPQRISTGGERVLADGRDFVIESLKQGGVLPRNMPWHIAENLVSVNGETIQGKKPHDHPLVTLGVNDGFAESYLFVDVDARPTFVATDDLNEYPCKYRMAVHTLPPRSYRETALVSHAIQQQAPHLQVKTTDQRPLLVFVLGDPEDALGVSWETPLKNVAEFAKNHNYQMAITTSRRTTTEVEGYIQDSLASAATHMYLWHDPEHKKVGAINLYPYWLDKADLVVATGDSLSMMGEGPNGGKKTLVLVDPFNGFLTNIFCLPMIDNLQTNKLAQVFNPSINPAKIPIPDVRKTGWGKVAKRLCAVARKRLKDRKFRQFHADLLAAYNL